MVQITNWCARPVGEAEITEKRSQWQSGDNRADSDLEVRVWRVGALLAIGPLGFGFCLKTRRRISLWPLCRFTTEIDLTGDYRKVSIKFTTKI